MSITSEMFYRAECDELKCTRTIPDVDDHEASHWPLESVEEYLREPHEERDTEVFWFYEDGRTLCPEHHPDARPCASACNGGMVKVDGPPPTWPADREWSHPHHWESCPECHGVGFHTAPRSEGQGA
tara:strand:+ start:51 stop:431 length:381 start_codon:yes stop_codon:yes gene_type:complete